MAGLVNYKDKHVVVVGGATGMGAAAAVRARELGATTTVLDVADIQYHCDASIRVDLSDRASVDDAVGRISTPVDAVLACAGVADGTPNLMLINFIAQRHLVRALVDAGAVSRGGSICFVSSVAGLGWMNKLETLTDFLAKPDWDDAVEWLSEHPGSDGYSFSKESINAFVALEAFPLLKKGLRVNAVLPGPTDTPLARANAETWLSFGADYRADAAVETLAPDQIGDVMMFLCSDAASAINGVTLLVDHGHVPASLVGGYDAPLVKMIAGLTDFDPAVLGQ